VLPADVSSSALSAIEGRDAWRVACVAESRGRNDGRARKAALKVECMNQRSRNE
jgi:hypothetical protein